MILVTQWKVRPEWNIRPIYLSLVKSVFINIEGTWVEVSKLPLVWQHQVGCQTEQESFKEWETLRKPYSLNTNIPAWKPLVTFAKKNPLNFLQSPVTPIRFIEASHLVLCKTSWSQHVSGRLISMHLKKKGSWHYKIILIASWHCLSCVPNSYLSHLRCNWTAKYL